MASNVKPIPDGYHTVTPYLVVENAEKLLEFLTSAFDARVTFASRHSDGAVGHAEVKIGDSMIMIGRLGLKASQCHPCCISMSQILMRCMPRPSKLVEFQLWNPPISFMVTEMRGSKITSAISGGLRPTSRMFHLKNSNTAPKPTGSKAI